jgi:hypothetical protein
VKFKKGRYKYFLDVCLLFHGDFRENYKKNILLKNGGRIREI